MRWNAIITAAALIAGGITGFSIAAQHDQPPAVCIEALNAADQLVDTLLIQSRLQAEMAIALEDARTWETEMPAKAAAAELDTKIGELQPRLRSAAAALHSAEPKCRHA